MARPQADLCGVVLVGGVGYAKRAGGVPPSYCIIY